MASKQIRVRYLVPHTGEQVEMSVGEYVAASLRGVGYGDMGQVEQLDSELGDLRDLVIRLVDVLATVVPVEKVYKILGETSRWDEAAREVVEVPDV